MFANLKNKLIEEVKASPSKFQQLANAAQAAVSSSSSTPSGSESTATTTTTNENFFSIAEEDTPQNSPYKPLKLPPGTVRGRSTTPQALLNNGAGSGSGAIPRTRKLSNSSMASDISFRLPSYDAPAVYHLQSDLDETASEIDDSASTARLDVITKEQLYDAYKKSLDRYHKYRCRYTDLAKKYKDLERDSTKARSVLVETQEKAIRRINELREQCSLEQQAKAHLEEALRMEMDDMQCKMQAYQTKLKLLGENPEHIAAALDGKLITSNPEQSGNAPLIELEKNGEANEVDNLINLKNEELTKTVESTMEANALAITVSAKVAELEKELKEREKQLSSLTEKMSQATSTIEQLRKQEEENALLLAQTKQAIHSELENKETEVKCLTENLKQSQNQLQELSKKEEQLKVRIGEVKELKEQFKQMQASKQEVDAKLIASEHLLNEFREQLATKEKSLVTVEEKINTLTKENEQKLQDLRQQNSQLSEMVQRYQQNEVSLAEIDNELNRTKNENDNLRSSAIENERKLHGLQEELNVQKEKTLRMEQAHLQQQDAQLQAELSKLDELRKQLEDTSNVRDGHEQRVKQLESEVRILNEQNANNESETISALKAEMHRKHTELIEQLESAKQQLAAKEKELKAVSTKLTKQKKQHESQQHKISEQNDELEKLRQELNKHEQILVKLQTEARERETQTELEKNELKSQVSNILNEISQMEEQMRIVKESHGELETEKRNLEARIEQMQKQAVDSSEHSQKWRVQLTETEQKLHAVEVKLLEVQSENAQLAEKNCLLEESSHRLEKLLAERERNGATSETIVNEMRVKLETAEDVILKLNEKMSQVLDENSRMQNAQELMDHDYRTLQDKCDAMEKEKLLAQDAEQCLHVELSQLKEHRVTHEARLKQLVSDLQKAEEKWAEERKRGEDIAQQLQEVQQARARVEAELGDISGQLEELRTAQSDDNKLRELLAEKQRQSEELQQNLIDNEREVKLLNEKYESEIVAKSKMYEELEHIKEELTLLRAQKESLTEELAVTGNALELKTNEFGELLVKIQEVEKLKVNQEEQTQKLIEAETARNQLLAEVEQYKNSLEAQQIEMQKLQNQMESNSENTEQLQNELKSNEQTLQVELEAQATQHAIQITELKEKLQTANADVERLHESNDAFQVQVDQLKSKHELQVQGLEHTLRQLQEDHSKLQTKLRTDEDNNEKLARFEQIQLENEYLNKEVQQLEAKTTANEHDSGKLKEKLKSLQCELYVLQEDAEKHDTQLQKQQSEVDRAHAELAKVQACLSNERVELARQTEYATQMTELNDSIQKELLHVQTQLGDVEQKLQHANIEVEQEKAKGAQVSAEAETLRHKIDEIATTLQEQKQLQDELKKLREELAIRQATAGNVEQSTTLESGTKTATSPGESEYLRQLNDTLQRELEDLKSKSSAHIDSLQQEIEDLQNNNKHMMERMCEMESIRAGLQAQKLFASNAAVSETQQKATENVGSLEQEEREQQEAKLKAIMTEVQEVSNRNLFLEQKCENYLILEQSNERLKLQNAKLSRQLDETLVSMQHNENITANTEFEYLKNIMFQYLTGTANGNNETLVKVISAVLKFSPQQTQVALEKEHQRRSLLNKIL